MLYKKSDMGFIYMSHRKFLDLSKDAITGTVYSLEIEETPNTKKPKIYKDPVGNILSTGDIVISSGNNQ